MSPRVIPPYALPWSYGYTHNIDLHVEGSSVFANLINGDRISRESGEILA